MVADKTGHHKNRFVFTIDYGLDERERVEQLLENTNYAPVSFRNLSENGNVGIVMKILEIKQKAEVKITEAFEGICVAEIVLNRSLLVR
jgi:endo-alpha-1,4-polygalactosaminidase (GH114 family)